jgi:protein-tyrosine phosphatase/membrane-associated phospholipid phosphatase
MTGLAPHPRASRLETLAWTVGLSAVWVAIYTACNWVSSQRADVRTLQFEWERSIPFIPWLLIPYMSIDLFFVAAPFCCKSRHQLHVLVARLLCATLIAAFVFLAIPMTLAAERPTFDGPLGAVYDFLKGADQPHNMCPSLHVALLFVLWPVYHRATRGLLRIALYLWFTLILISVLPVFQHHFVDVVGGILVALICVIAFPETAHAPWFIAPDLAPRIRIARRFALAGLPLIALGITLGPWGLIPGWVGGALLLVACIYVLGSPALFRKHNGKLPLGTSILLAPYLLGLRASRRHFARRSGPGWSRITDSLIIGRRTTHAEALAHVRDGVVAVIDMTAEHDEREPFRDLPYLNLPVLDLVSPCADCCARATAFIDEHAPRGTIYIHCGLGYSRSAMIAAAYLIHSGEGESADEACRVVERLHPRTRLGESERRILREFAAGFRRDAVRPC